METAQRIEAARQRLTHLRASVEDISRAAANLGPPCNRCRHFKAGGWSGNRCLNPVNHEAKIEGFSLVVGGSENTKTMRAADGLCGPEAILFEKPPLVARIPWILLGGIVWMAIFVGLGVFVFGPLGLFALLGFMPIGASVEGGRPFT
jgi:hypothetical protein